MKKVFAALGRFAGRMAYVFFGAIFARLGWEMGGLLWRLGGLALLGGTGVGMELYFGH